MKKLFIVLAVSSLGFVACNNEASTDSSVQDSITKDSLLKDSVAKAEAAAAALATDTTHKADTLPKVDTAKK